MQAKRYGEETGREEAGYEEIAREEEIDAYASIPWTGPPPGPPLDADG